MASSLFIHFQEWNFKYLKITFGICSKKLLTSRKKYGILSKRRTRAQNEKEH